MADLTPSEFRDRLVTSQEFKDRFTFPTQTVHVEGRTNNSPGRQEYQLVIGNDADFHIQGLTGGYAYHYVSAEALALMAQVNSIIGLIQSGGFSFPSVPSVADIQADMTAWQAGDYKATYISDIINFLIGCITANASVATGFSTILSLINAALGYANALTAEQLSLLHGFAEDATDDISVRIIDGKNSRLLTEGFVPLKLILSPGQHGNPLRLVLPFSHIIQRNSYMRLEFVNATPSDSRVEIAFAGTKFFAL